MGVRDLDDGKGRKRSGYTIVLLGERGNFGMFPFRVFLESFIARINF